jgi:hypothetical protein
VRGLPGKGASVIGIGALEAKELGSVVAVASALTLTGQDRVQ